MSERLTELYADALEIADTTARAAFLDRECAGEAALRREVEELLAADAQLPPGSSFLGGGGAATPAEPEEWAGRYRLREKLGEGGWGVVYRSEQTEPVRREVALKIIRPGMDSRQVLARFAAERQALAMMDHPNIARVLDAGETEAGRPYFVMELVRGLRLTDFCDKHRLTVPRRLELFVQVCQAVQHAHQKGIIHRDLKPSNILVGGDAEAPVPKVIDFGIAKATAEGEAGGATLHTQAGILVGTPAYMSPEQVLSGGADIDTRSDVYALGVLLHELLTGRPPFEERELLRGGFETLRRVIVETLPARPSARLRQAAPELLASAAAARGAEPSRLLSGLQGDLDWIVLKALEKDRARRYESAGALAQDVQRHLRDEPVTARAPGTWDSVRRLVRRHRLVFYPAMAGAAALVLGMGVATALYFRERAAKQRAESAEHGLRESAEASRRELVRLNVSTGNRLAEAGGFHPAMLWHVEALQLERGDMAAGDVHRRRIAMLRRMAPRLEALWPLPGVAAAEFTANGDRVIARDGSGRGAVWDVRTLRRLAGPEPVREEWWRGDFGAPEAAAAVVPGLALTVVPGGEGRGRVVDRFAGRDTGMVLDGAPAGLTHRFTRDGSRAAAASGNRLWCWYLPDPAVREIGLPPGENVRLFSLCGAGARMAVVTEGPQFDLVVRDFAGERETLRLKKPAGDIMALQLSPDSRRVAVGSWDGYARVFDAGTGTTVGDAMRHARGVSAVDFSPDSRRLATASWDSTARLWDAASGRALSPALQHAGYVPGVKFSPDGTRLMTHSSDGIVRLWKVDGAEPARLTLTIGGRLTAADSSPDGRLAAAIGSSTMLHVWSTSDGTRLVHKALTAPLVSRLRFSPDSRLLAAGFADGRVEVLDVATGEHRHAAMRGHQGRVESLTFDADGARLLSTSWDGTACVWLMATGQLAIPPLREESEVLSGAFSPDGRTIVTGSARGRVRQWQAADGRAVGPGFMLAGQVRVTAFDAAGQRLLTAAADSTQDPRSAQLWHPLTGKPAGPPLMHRDGVLKAHFSPDQKWIVTTGEDTMAVVWNAATGAPHTPPLRHRSYVWDAGFSGDSRLLFTVSMDGTARVWEVATGEPVTPPLAHDASVSFARWLPGDHELLTAAADGTVRVWDLSPAGGSADELRREAERLSAHRMSHGQGLLPLGTAEILERQTPADRESR